MNKSYWLEHDYNAANDAKILFLRQQLGMEGYGIYWFIVEQLVQAGGKLPLKVIPVLSMQSQTQESKVRAVIEGYELFAIEDDCFFSLRLNKHIEIRKYYSEMGKKGVEIREARRGALRGSSSDPLSTTDRQTNRHTNSDFGKKFNADNTEVIFNDGSSQKLGQYQLLRLKEGNYEPHYIRKGIIE